MAVSKKLKKNFKDEQRKTSSVHTAIKVILILLAIAAIPFVFLNPDLSLGPFDFLRKGFFVSEIKMSGHKYDASGLTTAIKKNELRIVKLFVRSNYNLSKYNSSGNTVLCVAARAGNPELVQALFSGNVNIAQRNYSDGLTPVCCAIQGGNTAVIDMFINKGVNINSRLEFANGINPLHLAAAEGKDEVITYLLSKGANVNAEDLDGRTPLHYACKQDKLSVLYILLNSGANPKAQDEKGITPIDIAQEMGYANIVDVLKQNGAVQKPVQTEDEQSPDTEETPVE